MTRDLLLETFEKQVNLVSECSEKCAAESDAHGLTELSAALASLIAAWSNSCL